MPKPKVATDGLARFLTEESWSKHSINEDSLELDRRDILAGLAVGVALFVGHGIGVSAAERQPLGPETDQRALIAVIGVFQPFTEKDLAAIVEHLSGIAAERRLKLPALLTIPDRAVAAMRRFVEDGIVLRQEASDAPLHALTIRGAERLNDQGAYYFCSSWRAMRDKSRLFLLRGPQHPNFQLKREEGKCGMGGDPPLFVLRSLLQDAGLVPASSTTMQVQGLDRVAINQIGPSLFSRDPSSGPLWPFLSFRSLEELRRAGVRDPAAGSTPAASVSVDENGRITVAGLALALGVSEETLRFFVDRRGRYYRFFDLNSRGSSKPRPIQAPRVFLKVMQRFVLELFLKDQAVHDSVHSYIRSASTTADTSSIDQAQEKAPRDEPYARGIISNASQHVGRQYLAKLDVKNFFGSVTEAQVKAVFEGLELFDQEAADLLTRLCTLNYTGSSGLALPQGAPTSPALSNLAMREFDDTVSQICGSLRLTYTRYADDIAISGGGDNDDPNEILKAITFAFYFVRHHLLDKYNMRINQAKSAISPKSRQHRVTGIVVNEKVLPPAAFRDRVRAMFDQFSKDPQQRNDPEIRRRLRGYFNYFRQFPDFPPKQLERYESVLSDADLSRESAE